MWVGRLFYIPAFAGGIFGLLGGYLTDRLGRRRVLTFSILIYAVAAFASAFATSIGMLLVLRCFVFIGVCVEFIAATLSRAGSPRASPGLHPGILIPWRPPGGDGERSVCRVRRTSSGD
jgi:MFS family permease